MSVQSLQIIITGRALNIIGGPRRILNTPPTGVVDTRVSLAVEMSFLKYKRFVEEGDTAILCRVSVLLNIRPLLGVSCTAGQGKNISSDSKERRVDSNKRGMHSA